MAYVVDFKLPPKVLMLGLINDANPGLNLTIDKVTFSTPVASKLAGYNTQLSVTWNTTDGMVGTVNVDYNRIDLDVLFSECGLELYEKNIDIVNDQPVVNDRLWAEIYRRYGVVFTSEDFDYSGGTLLYDAANVAYQGTEPIVVRWSLEHRVAKTKLNGFMFISNMIISMGEGVITTSPIVTHTPAVVFTANRFSHGLIFTKQVYLEFVGNKLTLPTAVNKVEGIVGATLNYTGTSETGYIPVFAGNKLNYAGVS